MVASESQTDSKREMRGYTSRCDAGREMRLNISVREAADR